MSYLCSKSQAKSHSLVNLFSALNVSQHLSLWKNAMASSVFATTTSLMALGLPAQALEVQVNPNSPRLGETISVRVQVENAQEPMVKMNGQTFPVFPISGKTTPSTHYRALLPTSPLDNPGKLTIQVTGDGETKNIALNLAKRSFPTQRITLRGGGSNATQVELDRVAAFKKIVSSEKYWSGAFKRPTRGRVSTIFGVRRYYNGVFAKDYYHRGVDYAAGTGTPVVAPAGGKVALVGRESQGFRVHGNTVGLDHGQGVLSVFLHLNQISVKEGDFVKAGQKIGTVGSTGASTGPHLHWGLYVHGVAIDPVPWRYEGVE